MDERTPLHPRQWPAPTRPWVMRQVWNDLLFAYVFLGGAGQNRVLTVALRELVGSRGENWHLLTSAAFISMALPLIVFFALQKYFVRGLTAGAVKG